MKRFLILAILALLPTSLYAADDPAPLPLNPAIYDGVFTDGPLTNFMNLAGRTDENGYLRVSGAAPGVTDGPLTNFGNLKARTDENGYLRISFAGAQTISVPNIQITSTDGLIVTNATAALVGTTTQWSPRIKLCGTAWKSNATAVSEVDCWIIENRPVTGAAVTTSSLWFASSIAGGAYTDFGQMRSDGTLIVPNGFSATSGGFIAASAGNVTFGSRNIVNSSADGLLNSTNSGGTVGIQLNVGTAAPTLTTCGTGAVTSGSRNVAGQGTATGATVCTVTFGTPAWAAAPFCTVTDGTGARALWVSGATTLLFTVNGLTSNDVFTWTCIGSK